MKIVKKISQTNWLSKRKREKWLLLFFLTLQGFAWGQATISVSKTNPTCSPLANGSITINVVSGGNPNYTYRVLNGTTEVFNSGSTANTSHTFSNVIAGDYNIEVIDGSGTATSTVSIVSLTGGIGSGNISNVTCNDGNDGKLKIIASGGTAPYYYSWSGNGNVSWRAGTHDTLIDLSVGTYTCTITDNSGCTSIHSATVTQPDSIVVKWTTTNYSQCLQGNSFSYTSSILHTAGTPISSYSWNFGSSSTPATSTNSSPSAVTYSAAGTKTVTLQVTDVNGCKDTFTSTVNINSLPTVILTTNNITCNGLTDGSLLLNPNSGTAPYTYSWAGTGSVSSVTGTNYNLTGLAAGTYNYTVTDANGCTKTGQATVQEPLPISNGKVRTNVACNGGSTGAVTLSPTGGSPIVSPSYIYAWTGPFVFTASTKDVSGLPAGTYNITITDNNGCSLADTVLISENAAISISESITDVSCNGGTNGAIDVTVSGGVSPYSYAWTPTAVSEDLTNLTAGTYNLVVTDAKSCTSNKSISVIEPTALTISYSKVNVLCNGASTGSIDISVSGGTSAYTYSWSGPGSFTASTEDLSNIAAGSYTFTVTDANNCTATSTIVISEPTALSLSTSQVNLLCNGASTGSIDLTISGGVSTYNHAWTGPASFTATSEDLSALTAGKYDVTVTDANGCTATTSATLTEPTAISISSSNTNVSCNSLTDGAINISVSGGTVASAYTYAWDNSSITEDLTGLAAGNYAVTVTDDNGCTKTASFTITEPAVLSLSKSVSKVLCNGNADGAIDLTVSGGTTAYTYSWVGPNTFTASSEDITALLAGDYDITVTDANNCQISDKIAVTEPTAMALIFTRTEVKCKNESNGAIDVTVSGGTVAASYTYDWASLNGFTSASEDISALAADEYTYTITDDNGCVLTDTINVSEPNLLTTNIASVSVCDGQGTLTFNGVGGTAPYTHLVDRTAATSPVTNLPDKVYEVYTTDFNGCNDSVLVNLIHNDGILPTVVTKNITVYLDNAGLVSIKTSDIDNGSFDNCGVDTMYLDKYNFDCTNTGANTVTLTVVDINTKTATKTATVTVLDTISPTITVQDATLVIDTTGTAMLKENMVVVNYNDNCGTDTIVLSKNLFQVVDYGVNNVNVTITDLSGNTVVKTVKVTVLIGDNDNDSIPDYIEKHFDTDSDGTHDFADVDSDNDGILDIVENDSNKTFQDFDGDGRPNHLDLDSDNDGINDVIEADVLDADGDGVKDNASDFVTNPANTDLTGNPDYLDLDADDDGLSDAYESKQNYTDANSDGIIDGVDADGDGIVEFADGSNVYRDAYDVKPVDSDGDNTGDWRDKDSDGDLIPDAVEFSADKDADGMPNYLDRDSDNDSIPDQIEAGIDPNNPVNTDGGFDPDYLDTDSDGDMIPDNLEAGANPKSPVDTDGDTKPDYIDLDSDDDSITDAIEAGANGSNPNDFDNDGVYDFRETDSDNDGISDKIEAGADPANPANTDGDAEPDYRDLDSDDDGIIDNTEWLANPSNKNDFDGDGKYNYVDTDSDGDEILDKDETTADLDNDGKPDYLDADATIPEGFSPNGDNDNDLLIIKGLKVYPNAELIIFNRNGQIVYESGKGYQNNWDGTNKGVNPSLGTKLPEGIYFYVFKYNGNNQQPINGNIYIKS